MSTKIKLIYDLASLLVCDFFVSGDEIKERNANGDGKYIAFWLKISNCNVFRLKYLIVFNILCTNFFKIDISDLLRIPQN